MGRGQPRSTQLVEEFSKLKAVHLDFSWHKAMQPWKLPAFGTNPKFWHSLSENSFLDVFHAGSSPVKLRLIFTSPRGLQTI